MLHQFENVLCTAFALCPLPKLYVSKAIKIHATSCSWELPAAPFVSNFVCKASLLFERYQLCNPCTFPQIQAMQAHFDAAATELQVAMAKQKALDADIVRSTAEYEAAKAAVKAIVDASNL